MTPEEMLLVKRTVLAWRNEAYRGNLRLTFLNKDMTNRFVEDMDAALNVLDKVAIDMLKAKAGEELVQCCAGCDCGMACAVDCPVGPVCPDA